MGQTIDGIAEIAKGVISIVGGGLTVVESEGALFYFGVAEIGVGETEIAVGISMLSSAPDPTGGVNYIADPNAPATITLPTVEIAGTPEPTVITTSELIIYGTPPAGVTPENIITLPTIEITDLPEDPPVDEGGGGDEGGG